MFINTYLRSKEKNLMDNFMVFKNYTTQILTHKEEVKSTMARYFCTPFRIDIIFHTVNNHKVKNNTFTHTLMLFSFHHHNKMRLDLSPGMEKISSGKNIIQIVT